MLTVTESLWPKKVELPKDEVVDFLKEQGALLAESTEGLLIAKVIPTYLEPTPTEVINYKIVPENGFLHSLGYRLFKLTRVAGAMFPITMTVYPTSLTAIYEVVITDAKMFLTEYSKIVKSDETKSIIAHMGNFVKGYRSDEI